MNSKKKLMITISSFALVFVSAIVAVVAIFAAQRQGVQSTFRVTYRATNVAASVQANYTVGNVTTAMLTDTGEDILEFEPVMAEGTGELSPETDNIELEEESVVYLEYIFSNNSNTVDVAISLDTTGFVLNNMNVSYAYSYTRVTDYETMPTDDSFEPMMILGKTDENGDYDTLYVYMKIAVSNLANDASFTGPLLFDLKQNTAVRLEFGSISQAGIANELLLQPRYVPANTNINDLPTPYFVNSDEYGYGYMGATWMDLEGDYGLRLPLNISTDTVLRAANPYIVTPGNKNITLSKSSDATGNRYVKASNVIKYTYGEAEYTVSGEKYLMFREESPITLLGIENVSANRQITPLDLARVGVKVVYTPSDLEEKMFYAAYGTYPQTYVGNELNETLKSASLTPTGKSYTTDINGTETSLVEYNYNGKSYAKLENSGYYGPDGGYFLSGEVCTRNQIYYFYVEPIVAKAMQKNANGTYTMMTVNALGSRRFDDSSNAWETSSLRTYLNGTFMNESGLSDVVETTIKNNETGNYDDGSGEDTNDKLWLASVEEILIWCGLTERLDEIKNLLKYDGYPVMNGELNVVKVTDLLIATYVEYSEGYASYILRSSGNYSPFIVSVPVLGGGGIDTHTDYGNYYYYGFCPVFAVNV